MDLIRFVPHASLAALVLAAASTAGLAQSPGEAPKPACTKPMEYPGNVASDRQKRTWLNEVNAYLACVKKFSEDQNAIAQVHVKAANAAIEEFNATAKATNELLKPSQ